MDIFRQFTFNNPVCDFSTPGLRLRAASNKHGELVRYAGSRTTMVKRLKNEDLAGVLEFAGRSEDDPEFIDWLAEHKLRKGGKIHVAKGGTGVRVMFSKAADLTIWKLRSEQLLKRKVVPAA